MSIRSWPWVLGFAAVALAVLACANAAGTTSGRPLVPRAAFFGPALFRDPRLSPDGRMVAYVAPDVRGIDAVWTAPVATRAGQLVSAFDRSGIKLVGWTADSTGLLILADATGDEADHLFVVDVATSTIRDLTPYPGVKAQDVLVSAGRPRELLTALNRRDRRVFDVYRVNLDTGEVLLDTANPGLVLSWVADSKFVIRAATSFDPDTAETLLLVRNSADSPWRTLGRWAFEDSQMFGQANGGSIVAAFGPRDETLYVVSASGSDTAKLVEVDARSGKLRRIVAHDTRSDVVADPTADGIRPLVMVDPISRRIAATGFEFERWRWHFEDARVAHDIDRLARRYHAFPIVISRDQTDSRWIVELISERAPVRYALLDRRSDEARIFGEERDAGADTAAPTVPVHFKARDGRALHAYLTTPRVRIGRVPLVVYAHGGPWDRDDWGFDPTVQWLADRGYAVIQVNFRGSTGYGKDYLNGGNGQFGLAMQDDLEDGARWSIERGLADSARIAIMGFSGGGFAALRGLSKTPGRYACGVDVVGPSDLGALISTFAPWMQAVRTRWIRRLGDLEHDEALRERISPVFHASEFAAPVFIAQGVNDARVLPQHAERMVSALRAVGRPVVYVTYPQEGHNFDRPADMQDLYGRIEEFLGVCLHGSVEPWSAIPGAAVSVQ